MVTLPFLKLHELLATICPPLLTVVLLKLRVVKSGTAGLSYPFTYRPFSNRVLTITMDPLLVDVNVHPAKLEVRLSKEAELFELIEQGVKAAFKSSS